MTRVVPVAAVGLLLAALAGCAPAPAAAPTVDAVVAERRALLESAERERFDAFVASSSARIAELGVPVPTFQGVVARDEWPAVVAACIDRADPRIRADRDDERLTVAYFGMVGEDYDRSRWAIESCSAQFGVLDARTRLEPGPIERAWLHHDAARRILPCLRGAGLPAPTLPAPDELLDADGVPTWSPYAALGDDPAALMRALALCPPSAALVAEREAAEAGR